MPRTRSAGFPTRLVILAAAAGIVAGYSASSLVRSTSALPADGSPGAQASNSRAKTDSLASLIRTAVTVPEAHRYAPAAGVDLDRFYGMVTAVAPMTPLAEPPETAPAAEPEQPQALPANTRTAATPMPAAKPKALPPPPAAPAPMGLLDDAQIAGIKGRLRLTAEQAEYWPPVETALRAVAKVQLREMRANRNSSGKVNIDVSSSEVQQLIWASMPLLRQLREDQKREVRRLVRVIGLEQVASQI